MNLKKKIGLPHTNNHIHIREMGALDVLSRKTGVIVGDDVMKVSSTPKPSTVGLGWWLTPSVIVVPIRSRA